MAAGDGRTTSTRSSARAALSVAALGVVFGDIGTSPIYTIQTLFNPADPHPVPPTAANVYGLISLIFWSVTIIVTVKYVLLVMRADNDGEGGILSLITLIKRKRTPGKTRTKLLLAALGVFGASLFFGDSMITPAISVLSSVEGLEVVEPELEPLVIPITAVIIVGLFAAQRFGTARVGRLFGPVMMRVVHRHRGLRDRGHPPAPADPGGVCRRRTRSGFLFGQFQIAFFALAGVVLAITGAEALYADLGHFGRPPITRAWLILVFPACILSYLGQGALVVNDPQGAISNPFFLLVPDWGRLPMVLLATAATVIASQAVITRRVLGGAPGRPSRLPASAGDPAHLGADRGPDLRPVGQLGPHDRRPGAGVRVPVLDGARVRVRDGGDRHHRDHHRAVLLRRPAAMGQTSAGW